MGSEGLVGPNFTQQKMKNGSREGPKGHPNKKALQISPKGFFLVAGTGLEPVTFGL
jgi:hypothetical protein